MAKRQPWWTWVVLALLGLMALGAIVGDEDERSSEAPMERTDTTSGTAAARTLADARRAVDRDDYATAIPIAAAIGAQEEDGIARRISNRLAARTLAALRAGERGRARTLLIEADDYPTTARTRRARASYQAAKRRAVARRQQARRAQAAARAQRKAARDAAAARRDRDAQAQTAPDATPGSDCDPNYEGACLDPSSADYDCAGGSGDGPDYTGPVRSVGSDPFDLDRDGDGLACERS